MPSYSNSHFLIRFLRFFVRNIFKNFSYVVLYTTLFFKKEAKAKAKEYTFEEVSDLIRKGKSLIRFGDGEVHIINFGSIHYENFNAKLREIFLNIIKGYTIEAPYVLGLNTWALEKSNIELRKHGQLYCWLPLKVQFQLIFPKNIKYFDASLFYRRNIFEKYVLPYIENKHVILISKKDNCDHVAKKMMFRNISYVHTPDFHSYTKIHEITSRIDEILLGKNRNDVVLLVSCGPASKVVCYEYAMKNIQSIDVGRGLELVGTDTDLEHMLL